MVNYPVLHYKFYSNVLDCSANTNDGTATNVTYDSGYSGKAAYFNGTDSKVETSYFFDANDSYQTSSFSVFVRFKITETKTSGKWHSLVDAYAGTGDQRNFQMFVNDQNKLVVYHCDDTGYEFPNATSVDPLTSDALTLDTWYNALYVYDHSVSTSDGGLGVLYLDRSDNFVAYALIPGPNASTANTEIHLGTRADENADGFAKGYIDEFQWFTVALEGEEIDKLMNFFQEFDIWIKQRSFVGLSDIRFRASKNLIAGDFTALIADRDGALLNHITFEDDVMIFIKGTLKFKGKVEQIIPTKNNNMVRVIGKDYTTVLFERILANTTYTNLSRKDIIEQIIDDFLKQSFGPAYFTYGTDANSSIEDISTELITKEYGVTTVARALLGFMEELNAQIIIEPSVSMPLTIRFAQNSYNATGIVLDYDTRSNNTSGHTLRRYSVSKDSKQIRNVFTVYGPASSAIAVAVRDEDSIAQFGEKRSKPIVDTSATTVALARQRAEEEKTKWNTVIEKGEFEVKLNDGYAVGDTILVSIDAEGYNLVEVVLVEVEYYMRPQKIRLLGIALLGGSEDIISQVVKEMTTIDLRDADAASPISQIFTTELYVNVTFKFTITEYGAQGTTTAIGIWQIGSGQIGYDLTEGSETVRVNAQTAIMTNQMKINLNKLLAGVSVDDLRTNLTLLVGNGTAELNAQSSDLGGKTGSTTPSTIDTEGDYSAKWYFTITDNEISIGDYIREIGIARNGGGGSNPLLLGYNLPTAIQNTNSNFFEVELEMTIS